MSDTTGPTDSDHTHSVAPADPASTVGADGTTEWFPAHYVQGLRKENAGLRVRAKESTSAELVAARAEVKALKVGQALTDVAIRLGANPRITKATLLMDGHLTGLDPDKADFLPALEALVQTAMENEPELLKGAQPPTAIRAGSDLMGQSFTAPKEPLTQVDLKFMTPEQVEAAYRSGATDEMLGRKR